MAVSISAQRSYQTQSWQRLSRRLAAEELLKRRLARSQLISFIHYTLPVYSNPAHQTLLAEKLEAVERGEIKRLMVFMPPRHLKALTLDTPIPTPSGWKQLADIAVGDEIFAGDGSITKVKAVSSIFRKRPIYKVTNNVGQYVFADKTHDWLVRLERKRPNVYVKHETEWLFIRQSIMSERRTPEIPTHKGLDLPTIDLPIPPYTLGIWLGDGNSHYGAFTCGEEDREFIRKEIEKDGFVTKSHKDIRNTGILGLVKLLRENNLLKNKHIPPIYLRASQTQRLALLQGLMDTDGHVAKDGQASFCSMKENLAKEVRELITSLGIKSSLITTKAKLNGKCYGLAYSVLFYGENIARIPRKIVRCHRNSQRGHYLHFEPSGVADTKCLEVEHSSHTFLAGEGMFPTCNSETCSIRFPAWYLGRHPQNQIIGCSYAESLAYTFSYAVRETIASQLYQNLWPLKLDTSGAVRWQLAGKENRRPSYIAAGIGGGITGEGADVLVIDDPVRDYAEAMSETYRERAWNWWTTVAMTRLQPNAAVILVMTRWHEDDLAGRILRVARQDPQADQWEVLHFPAIKEGQALWPEKYPLDVLEKIRAGQVEDPGTPGAGSRAFEALYQGNPSVAEGNIFKREWWQFYKEKPPFTHILHSWDTAFKSSSENDYSVCTSWGVNHGGYYLLDVWRQKVEFPELKRVCRNLYDRDRPWQVLIEDKASGQSLIQELKRDSAIPLKPIKVDRDKVARAYAVTPLIEAGRVFVPERAAWLHEFIEELSTFPNGEHDDCVDSLTQALSQMAGSGRRYAFEM